MIYLILLQECLDLENELFELENSAPNVDHRDTDIEQESEHLQTVIEDVRVTIRLTFINL